MASFDLVGVVYPAVVAQADHDYLLTFEQRSPLGCVTSFPQSFGETIQETPPQTWGLAATSTNETAKPTAITASIRESLPDDPAGVINLIEAAGCRDGCVVRVGAELAIQHVGRTRVVIVSRGCAREARDEAAITLPHDAYDAVVCLSPGGETIAAGDIVRLSANVESAGELATRLGDLVAKLDDATRGDVSFLVVVSRSDEQRDRSLMAAMSHPGELERPDGDFDETVPATAL